MGRKLIPEKLLVTFKPGRHEGTQIRPNCQIFKEVCSSLEVGQGALFSLKQLLRNSCEPVTPVQGNLVFKVPLYWSLHVFFIGKHPFFQTVSKIPVPRGAPSLFENNLGLSVSCVETVVGCEKSTKTGPKEPCVGFTGFHSSKIC